MSCQLIALLALGQVAAATGSGTVTSVTGPVRLERSGGAMRLHQGAAITQGDRLVTKTAGKASFYLHDGFAIYLGPNTAVSLAGGPGAWRLKLDSGETRITAGGRGTMQVDTMASRTLVKRGIVRIRSSQNNVAFRSDHGEAVVYREDGQAKRLSTGQELFVADGQWVNADRSAEKRWSIRLAEFQLAQANGAGPESLRDIPALTDPSPQTQQDGADDQRRIDQPQEDRQDAPPDTDQQRGTDQTQGDTDQTDGDTGETNNQSLANAGAFSALSLGGFSGGTAGIGASGATFSDANQQTLQGMLTKAYDGLAAGDPFPGNIHLVTAQTPYTFDGVDLSPAERENYLNSSDPSTLSYWSIGTGAPPTSQVFTDFLTGTDPIPTTVAIPRIPGFADAYLIRLDQYGLPDNIDDPAAALSSNIGLTGLLGEDPPGPTIIGATPLSDERAITPDGDFNQKLTFTLGEFRLQINPDDPDNNSPELAIRRSAQDRKIVKDQLGNDANDEVTVNPDVVAFDDVPDPRFQPAVPTVKVPQPKAFDGGLSQTMKPTRYSNLNFLRKAATTTLMADRLYDYSQRTRQTRFVVDGNKIIDISGYRRK